jgi:hypothetical protein
MSLGSSGGGGGSSWEVKRWVSAAYSDFRAS